VIVLDENIIAGQCAKLRGWRIPFRQIGMDIGRKGMDDLDEMLPLLHRLSRPTFFTRDADFYLPHLRHASYCLVVLSVSKDEAATHIRCFLRDPGFDSRAKRMGCVVRVNVRTIDCAAEFGSSRLEGTGWRSTAAGRRSVASLGLGGFPRPAGSQGCTLG
jgi:hypothetical protein